MKVLALVLAAAIFQFSTASANPRPQDAPDAVEPALDEAQRLFYNGRYQESAAATAPFCTNDGTVVHLDACEVRSSALLFQIKRLLSGHKKKQEALKLCAPCQGIMTDFQAVITVGLAAARQALERSPQDEATRFLLGKIALNHVWLHLGLLGRKTGWGEYWEGRRSMDAVLAANPHNARAQVSRAWIDYIVDTQVPRGVRWLLGGGDKKRGLRVVEEVAAKDEPSFIKAEAGFAFWDMQVREGQVAGALATAHRLVRDYPENEELNRFLTAQGAVAQR